MAGRTSGRSRCRNRVHRLSSFVAACLLILAILTLLPIAEATAAGGAHIVDDSETEAPGGCHLETWVSRFVPGDGYANASPACTTMRLPRLELGAAYQHYWDQVIGAPLFGPPLKINFQHFDNFKKTIGVGLGLNAGVNLSTGNLGYASLPVLVTVPINEKVRLNFECRLELSVDRGSERVLLWRPVRGRRRLGPEPDDRGVWTRAQRRRRNADGPA